MVRPMKFRQWSVKRGIIHAVRKWGNYEASTYRKKRPLDQLAFLKDGSLITRKRRGPCLKNCEKVEYELVSLHLKTSPKLPPIFF